MRISSNTVPRQQGDGVYGRMGSYLPKGNEPKNQDLMETYVESLTESLTQSQFSEQRFLEDVDYDDIALEEMLHNAHRVHVHHSQREGLSVGQSSSSLSERTGRPVVERTGRSVVTSCQELNVEHAQIRTLLDRQKEQILAECQVEIKKHEFQANYDRRSVQKMNEIIEFHQEELHFAQAEELQRRDQQLLHAQLLQQNSVLCEAHNKSLNEMEELKKFQSSTFDTIARRRFVEDQDTVLELTGRIQELQNEINCMNDSRHFQDAESIRSGNSHFTSQPVSFPPFPVPGGMLSRSVGMPSSKDGPASIWDTHGIAGTVFANPHASSSAPYPQELNQWNSSLEEPLHSSTAEKSERTRTRSRSEMPVWTVSKKILSSSVEETLQRIMGQINNDCRFQIFILTKFRTPATFACWKIRFKTEVRTCSEFPTEAMHWIKEVEMVESLDDLKSSPSTRGIPMQNFEVLDARIASAVNRIIHDSHFKRTISLEEQKAQKQDRFLRGRQIACLIYEYFRVTGANDSVENCADLFTIGLRNDDIQEFDSKWDGILLSMTKILLDGVLEGLYKLRIRESEKLKTV